MNNIQSIQDHVVELEPLANVSLHQLPQRFQDCFDKAKTPEIEYFNVTSKTLFYWLVFTGMVIWFLIMFVQAFAASTFHNQLDTNWLAYNLLWCICPLIPLLLAFYIAVRKESYASRVESGDLRIGVIIHPEALLVRTDEHSFYLIPRHWLKAVTVQRYLHGKGLWATKVVFTDIDGNDNGSIIGINSFGGLDYFAHEGTFAAALRRWNPELVVRG